MNEIAHILRYKLLAFIKVNIDWSFESVIKNIGSFIVYAGFMVGTFFLTRNIISFLLEQAHVGLFLLHRFLSMTLYVFFLSINVGNIIVSYSTLYKSNEVHYLLTKPVSFTNLFVIKFLDNFFYSSTTLFVIGFAVLAGYASYFNLPWQFYVSATFLLFIPFMFLAAMLGVIMLMGLMKLVQVLGARLVVGTLLIGYIGSIYAFFKLTNPTKLVSQVMRYYPNIDQYFGFLDPPLSRFLPNHWITESLYWTVSNPADGGSNATFYIILLLGACALISVLALFTARRWYYQSWLAFLSLRVRHEEKPRRVTPFHLVHRSPLEPQTEVLLKKEFWQFFREPSQWIHLCVILVLIAIFVTSISQIEMIPGLPVLQAVAFLVVFLFNTFLISSIALRFVYPLISIEGETFWKTRSAPISLNKIAAIKYGVALVLALLIGQMLNGFSQPLTVSSTLFVVSGFNSAFVSLAMVTLSFGMGSLFATFKEKNPIRVASSQGASLTFLLSLMYMVFLVAVLFVPVSRYFELQTVGLRLPTSSFVLATGIIGVLSLTVSVVSYIISVRSLRRDL